MMRTCLFLVVLVCGAALGGCSDADERNFNAGRDLVAKRQYARGIEHLDQYLAAGFDQKNASRAVFFIGKARLGQGDLVQARQVFEQLLTLFPGSLEAHKARYKLGLIMLVEGDRLGALAEFSDLVAHPDGTLVPEAELMVNWLTAADPAGR